MRHVSLDHGIEIAVPESFGERLQRCVGWKRGWHRHDTLVTTPCWVRREGGLPYQWESGEPT